MPVTQYIGSRYVPLFADPAEWSSTKTYEPLTIVLHQGNSFTSKQFVPVGIDIDNTDFWALTGNYNAQVEQYRQETNQLRNALPGSFFDASNTVKDYVDGARSLLFATVAEMQASDLLYEGAVAFTQGFHAAGDYGASAYAIGAFEPNGFDILECENNLAAKLIVNDVVLLEQLGARAGEDASLHLQYAVQHYERISSGANAFAITRRINLDSHRMLENMSFIVSGSLANVFYGTNLFDITLRNVNIDYSNATLTGKACIFLDNVANVCCDECSITGNKTMTGIYLHFATDCIVQACTFHNTYFPVSIWGGEADPTISPNRSYGSKNVTVKDCVSTSDYTSTADMIYGSYWATNTDNCTFENNFVDGCYDVGIDLEFCINSKVIGNTIKNAYRGALGCLFGCIDCVYANNVIKFELDTTKAPQLPQSTYRVGVNNIIILCRNTNKNILFTGNMFASQQSVGVANVWYPSTDTEGSTVTLTDNFFHNCYVRSAQKNIISIIDNTFIADMVDVWFIEVRNAYKCRIAGNVATCNNEASTLLTSAFFLTSLASDAWHEDIDVVIRDNTLVKAGIRVQATLVAAHQVKIIGNECPRIGLNPNCFNGGAYVESPYDCVVGYQDSLDNVYASLPTTTELPANTMLPAWNPQQQNNQFMMFDGSAWAYKGAL